MTVSRHALLVFGHDGMVFSYACSSAIDMLW